MDYQIEYESFLKWIKDPAQMGLMGPISYTKEEAAFAKLFAAYLNCRYPSTSYRNNFILGDGLRQL